MKRVRMVLAYDGTNYCGWQLQPNGITIEEVLNNALSELLREPVVIIGASRTDSGVHAEGNVAVFDTENRMPADKICFALNQRLPEDIRVLESDEVPLDWHPRKQNCTKTYEYRILNRKISMPTLRLYSHFTYFNLDVEKMQQAADYLVGEHDFKSFCTVRTQAEETVRTIYSLDVTKAGDMITIRISGSGFLYNMVRIIAGTLLKVGMGVYPPEHVEEILEARDRQAAGPTAPARGLTLISMEYEKELRQKITGENKHWAYDLFQTEVPEKKKAYLVIRRCEDEEFDRQLLRVTHQAVRNGAREVLVCDRESDGKLMTEGQAAAGRIAEGRSYGYYQFVHEHDLYEMKKELTDGLNGQYAVDTDPGECLMAAEAVDQDDPEMLEKYCRIVNEIFFDVPNSAALTMGELKERLANENEYLFWLKQQEEIVGFLMMIRQGKIMEIDEVGLLENQRGRGLGKQALALAETLARKYKTEELRLLVSDKNKTAMGLYESVGYQKTKLNSRWYRTTSSGYQG